MAKNVVKLRWDGVKDAKDLLMALAPELHREGGGIVMETAQAAYFAIKDKYPQGKTGHLRAGLYVDVSRTTAERFGIVAKVRSAAPHAQLWERGTNPRETKTDYDGKKAKHKHRYSHRKGENRGAMPKGDVFVRTMQLHRARMFYKLGVLLRKKGLDVNVKDRMSGLQFPW